MDSSPPQKHQYHNLTISGLPGSGSTTLLRGLKEKLAGDGWRGFSGGEFMREYAKEKGLFDGGQAIHHTAEHYEDDFDLQVDLGMRQKLMTEKKWILESWLSGFMAQQVPGVLKVLMTCSDDAVRIDRIVNRDNISIDQAKDHIQQRTIANFNKWRRMYHQQWQDWVVATHLVEPEDDIDFWRPELYDLVVDTYKLNKEETLQTVIDAISQG